MTTGNRAATSLIIVVLTCIVGLLGAGVFRTMQLNASSQEFVLELTPQILNGQPEILAQHASAQLIQAQPLPVMTRFLNIVTLNMGSADVIRSITGGSDVPLLIFSNALPTATYTLEVEFANGIAQVDTLMRYENDTWQFTGFSVISDQLAD